MVKVKFRVEKSVPKNYPRDEDPLDLIQAKDVEFEFQDIEEIDWNDSIKADYYASIVEERYEANVLWRYEENGKPVKIQRF